MIAIFGSNGYLGRHMTAYCQKANVSCELFDIQEERNGDPVFQYQKCDICSVDFWNEFRPEKYSAIHFFAGLSGTELSFAKAELFLDTNIRGLVLMLKRFSSLGCKAPKVIFPSSRLVYRGGECVTEESVVQPRSVYAATKLACEGLLESYHARYGIPYSILRICVPFGNLLSKNYSYGTMGFFINKLRNGLPITLFGSGEYLRTFTHVLDICEIFYRMSNCAIDGVFNVGGHDYTLKQAAELLVTRFGGEIQNVPWPLEAWKIEMGNISLNAEKLNKTIGFGSYRNLSDYLDEV